MDMLSVMVALPCEDAKLCESCAKRLVSRGIRDERTRIAAAIRAEQARYWNHDEDVDVVLARLLAVVEGG